ncbi:MAG: hypothetical protein ACP5K5_03945, partial [Candidatus Micrarchaeia archaeon]
GKPTIGGYVTRSNDTMMLSLYNIPLAVQSTLIAEGMPNAYMSPVTQNPANETLMTLFNYQTNFVIILRNAYNATQLSTLVNYTTSIFGNPVYVDNATIAYETSNAIKANVFKSYVAYPYLPSWIPETTTVNGSSQIAWIPETNNSEFGSIAVYAPYSTNSSLSKALSGFAGTINTTISFKAFTNYGTAKVYVARLYNGSLQTLAMFNVTSTPSNYSLKAALASGPRGNMLLFGVPQNYTSMNHIVFFENITFSKA